MDSKKTALIFLNLFPIMKCQYESLQSLDPYQCPLEVVDQSSTFRIIQFVSEVFKTSKHLILFGSSSCNPLLPQPPHMYWTWLLWDPAWKRLQRNSHKVWMSAAKTFSHPPMYSGANLIPLVGCSTCTFDPYTRKGPTFFGISPLLICFRALQW